MKIRIQKADVLFSLLVRERSGNTCERCGRTEGKLDCSHHWPRAIKRLRWDPANAMCLCFQCHRWWHSNPGESGLWLRNTIGEQKYAYLLAAKMEPFKLDTATKAHILKNLTVAWSLTQIQRRNGWPACIPLPFSSPYEGEVLPLARKPGKRAKAKAKGPKKKIASRPFPKTHRPLRAA